MRRLALLTVAALLLCLPMVGEGQEFIRYYPPSGAAGLTSSGTAITSTLPIRLPDGTVSAPALSWASDTDSGMYFAFGTNRFAVNGSLILSILGTGLYVNGATAGVQFTDANIQRDNAANVLAQKNGDTDQFWRHYGTNSGYWERGVNSELLTIAAAATTDTTGNLLPADAIIESVAIRVTTVIPTAATFTVGDATTAARFATGVSAAATTTAIGLLHRHPDVAAAAGPVQTTAAKVRITPNASPAAATGVVRIQVYFSRWVAPTT